MFVPLGSRHSAATAGVEVDFGGGPVTVHPATSVVDLTPDGPFRVPATGPVDWTALDRLPRCRTVEWAGPERGVIAAVAARYIPFLYWHDASGDVDLTRTWLTGVRLGGPDLRQLRLPTRLDTLRLTDPPDRLRVDAAQTGHRIRLSIRSDQPRPVVPRGLRRVRDLWLHAAAHVSATALAGLTDLTDLRISFRQPPGTLSDATALRALRQLRTLDLGDAYDWDPADLPHLPALRCLALTGTRRGTATALRRRFGGTGVRLSVHGAKTDAWLAAHLTSPFRDWIEEGAAFGKAATAAYRQAEQAIDAIDPQAPDRLAAAERALRGLVADLNALQHIHGLIDTNLREQAGDAFDRLATRAGVPDRTAAAWFADRTF